MTHEELEMLVSLYGQKIEATILMQTGDTWEGKFVLHKVRPANHTQMAWLVELREKGKERMYLSAAHIVQVHIGGDDE